MTIAAVILLAMLAPKTDVMLRNWELLKLIPLKPPGKTAGSCAINWRGSATFRSAHSLLLAVFRLNTDVSAGCHGMKHCLPRAGAWDDCTTVE
jgi:hypothetical protein